MTKGTFINNNTFFRLFTFHRRGITCSSRSSRKYAPIPATEVMRYGPSQLGPSFLHVGFFTMPRAFLNTKSPYANGLSFTLAS